MEKRSDGPTPSIHWGSDRVLCYCVHKTAAEIRAEALRLELRTVEAVARWLCVGGGCTLCRPEIESLLKEIWGEAARPIS